MELKENNIVFLLGAGCSKEAGIPISSEMVTKVETLLNNDKEWQDYKDLYNYLKSSIDYSEGIFGNFGNTFNIEKLLIIMGQIEQRDKNIIYPFIGSWNIRLPEVAGNNFEKIAKLKNKIKNQLYSWVSPTQIVKAASYYRGFERFKSEFGFPLKVFSLNYDLCFEKIIGDENIEQGFSPKMDEWEQTNFDNNTKLFKLYKLHGSISWYTDEETGKLKTSTDPIIGSEPELIFGTDTKLDSRDPYFYYTTEFRQWILHNDCKLIVTIGYSYADDYINNLIAQALAKNPNRQVLNITFINKHADEVEEEVKKICKDITFNKLELNKSYNEKVAEQFNTVNFGAKDFLENHISSNFFSKYIKEDSDAPFLEET